MTDTILSAFVGWLPVVLSASLSASVLVLLVPVVIWMARLRFSPRWCHALWLVVFVRLALPGLPEVPAAITPPKPTTETVTRYITTLDAPATRSADYRKSAPRLEIEAPTAEVEAHLPQSAPRVWRWVELAAFVWTIGAACLLGVIWVSAWVTLRRWRSEAVPVPDRVKDVFNDLCRELGVRRQPRLDVCVSLHAPVAAGLWRPRILLPPLVAEKFTDDQLRHVLAHELGHLRRGDLWLHTGVAILQSVHWFNPLVWYAAIRLRAATERCCDEWALRRLSLQDGRGYGETLLQVLSAPGSYRGLPGIAAMAESKSDLGHRIRAVGKWSTRPRRSIYALATLLAFVAFIALTVPAVDSDEKPFMPMAETTVKVTDAQKNPLAGATVTMNGLRVAEQPADGYGWRTNPDAPSKFTTDAKGVARIQYPSELNRDAHVSKISFTVTAPHHVPVRYHEVDLSQPPATLELQPGSSLRLRALKPDNTIVPYLLVQDSAGMVDNGWENQPDGSQLNTELAPGAARVRVAWLDKDTGQMWFSRLETPYLTTARENVLEVKLHAAVSIKGSLAASVPRPVRNGSVRAYFMPPDIGNEHGFLWQATARVAEDGSFTIADCPPGDDAYVAAVCDGFHSTDPDAESFGMQPAVMVPPDKANEALVLQMLPTASLTVTVLGPDGKPAAGVETSIWPNTRFGNYSTLYGVDEEYAGRKMAAASYEEQSRLKADVSPGDKSPSRLRYVRTTDNQGKVQFVNLPKCSTSVSVTSETLELPPVEQEGSRYWRRTHRVNLKEGESANITLTLVGTGTTTLPKPKVVENTSPPRARPPRSHTFTPTAAPSASPNESFKPEKVDPDEFAGVVLDGDGRPLANANLLSYGLNPDRWMKTDEQGRFRYRLIEAKGRAVSDLVRIQASGYSPVTLSQRTGRYGFITMTSDTAVEGVVTDSAGKPVKDVQIRVEQDQKCEKVLNRVLCQSMPNRQVKTDEQGRYKIFVEPDYHTITAYGKSLGTCKREEVLVEKGKRLTMDFIADENVKLDAEMVDSETGKPVPSAELCILAHKNEQRWKADAQGWIKISGLLPGVCEFYPRHPDYARWWSDAALNPWQKLELVDNKKTLWQRNFDDLAFELGEGNKPVKIYMERGVTFRGRVLDPDGKPVTGATVDPAHTGTDNSLTGDTRFSTKTDADGRYELRIPASNKAQYNLVAHDGGYKEWRRWANGVLPAVKTRPGDVIENADIQLTRPGVVRGIVFDADGKPVVGQRVRTCPVDRNENRYYDPETNTDAGGRFELSFVRPGRHYLWASKWNPNPEDTPGKKYQIIDVKAGEVLEVNAQRYDQ